MKQNRTQEILYQQMAVANEVEVSKTAVYILDRIQQLKVHNQLLGLAAALVCLIDVYELKASDILGIAHNIVYNKWNETVAKNFAGIRRYMKKEWAIAKEW